MINSEVWKDVPEYEGLYKVSNLGRVLSCGRQNSYVTVNGVFVSRTRGGRILSLVPTKKPGYYTCALYDTKGNPKRFCIHMLVMYAFEGIRKGVDINHKDGNKLNNCLENLEYCTHQENMLHAVRIGLQKSAKGSNHYRSKKVIDTQTNVVYVNISEAARINNINKSSLVKMLSGGYTNRTSLKYCEA